MTAGPCSRHPNVAAEGACESCGRHVCIACAVPFRGEIRCATCAAREVGEETEEAVEAPGLGWGMDRAAGLAFAAGVLASLLPWDRVGSRSRFLAAWTPQPDPWPLLAGVLLLLAAVAALRPFPGGLTARDRIGYVGFGVLAVAATLLALPAPDFTVRSFVPYLVLAASSAGTILGMAQLRSSLLTP